MSNRPDRSDIYDALTEIFRSLFSRNDLVLTSQLTASEVPGWNSFLQIEIILAVEERFGITLHSGDVDQFQNVGDLAKLIDAKRE